jgi:hypothetical protein
MLFAIDKSNGRKLCQQVMDNPLLLILACSETANTLTTSILILGLPTKSIPKFEGGKEKFLWGRIATSYH